jgi:dolichol-phosphate mannosyltransferase
MLRPQRDLVTSMRTLIFIPTYNEHDNVRQMCEEILGLGLDADLVFMDDASPDGTGRILDELAQRHARVAVVHRTGKQGIGSAHLAGIALAYERNYTRLVTLDCDFTHSPSLIPAFLEASRDTDVVLGSRYLEPASLPGWTLFRKSLTTLGHLLTQSLLNLSEDATGGFRVYNLETIPRALFDLVQSRGYAFFFESLFILQRNGFRLTELPIALPARTYGSSKMTLQEVQRSVSTLLSLFVQEQSDPSRFRMNRGLPEIDRSLFDPQDWNEYWSRKQHRANVVYDAIATLYRNAVIKRRLESTIKREFPRGASLLHAGCGSGQIDMNLHEHARITAIDISEKALGLYGRHNARAHAVHHASILDLPFGNEMFDGAYNLGVVEHFGGEDLLRGFSEIRRVLKPKGKLVVFWPHAYASSVMVLNSAHWLLNDVLGKNIRLHPPEVSLVHSSREAKELLSAAGLRLTSYDFGMKDFLVQAVVVAERMHD